MKPSSQYRDLKPWVQKRAPMECLNKKKRKSEDWTLGCSIMWRPTEKEELAEEVKGKWMECGIIWTEGRKSFKKKTMVNWYEIQLRGQITWEKRIYHHISHQGNCGFVDYILHKDCGCAGEGAPTPHDSFPLQVLYTCCFLYLEHSPIISLFFIALSSKPN